MTLAQLKKKPSIDKAFKARADRLMHLIGNPRLTGAGRARIKAQFADVMSEWDAALDASLGSGWRAELASFELAEQYALDPSSDRVLVAFHEAGHAVVASALGCRFTMADIFLTDDGGRGAVRGLDHRHQHAAVVYVAGALAADRKSPRRDSGAARMSPKDESLLYAVAERRSVLLPVLRSQSTRAAATLLDQLWPWVERTAAALQERRELTAGEVRALATADRYVRS